MRARAVISDMDKTLIPDQGQLSDPEVAAIFRQLTAAGVTVGINTGRDRKYVIGPAGITNPDVMAELSFAITGGGGGLITPTRWHTRRLGTRRSRIVGWECRRLGIPSDQIWSDVCSLSTRLAYDPIVQRAIANVNRARLSVGLRPLDMVPTYNGDSVIYLPAGVDKGTSMLKVLGHLGIEPGAVVGCGDGENDLPFLALCGVALVPADAHPRVLALPNALISPLPGPEGVKFLLRQLLAGGIRGWSVTGTQSGSAGLNLAA